MKKAFNILLALFPILSGYGLSLSLDFGSLLIFIVGVGCIFVYPQQFRLKFPVGYLAFFIVALLLSFLWARSIPLRLLLFSVNLCLACCYADMDKLWKYYGIVVWVCVVFFLLQEVSFYTLGFRPSGVVSFLPTVYGEEISKSLISSISDDSRSSSFFLEPSFFAQFLIPYVAISLFSSNKSGLKRAIVASVIVLLVRSGVGILLLGVTWLLWFLFSNVKASTKIIVTAFAVTIMGVLLYAGSGMMDYFSSRAGELMSFSGDEQYQSSGFIRIFRGYYAFSELPTLNMLLGSHPDDVQALLERSVFFGTESTNFINGMQTLLFYHGIVGTFFYLRHIFLFPYKSKKRILIVLSLSVFVLLLMESFYLSSRLFVMTIFMYMIKKETSKSSALNTSKYDRMAIV